jgi:putative alpha-1,2-mannosidase
MRIYEENPGFVLGINQLRIRKQDARLEQNQSKRALDESLKGGFFLRKKPLEGIALGYSYSDFAITTVARAVGAVLEHFSHRCTPYPENLNHA